MKGFLFTMLMVVLQVDFRRVADSDFGFMRYRQGFNGEFFLSMMPLS